ncbi:MAG: globin [Spongiibacteraceae bacterium]
MDTIDFNELFNDSFEFVQKNSDEFYTKFYAHFVENSLPIQRKFSGVDVAQQQLMLKRSLVHLVNFFVTRTASPYLFKMAEKHKNINVSVDMYDYFMESLVLTMSKVYPQFTNECGLAWRITLAPGIELMKHVDELVEAPMDAAEV